MTNRPRFSTVAMTALLLGLLVILGFLYLQTRRFGASAYYENIAILRQMKQVDSSWERDVLKSYMGIENNYDSLVRPLIDLEQLRAHLVENVTDAKKSSVKQELSAALDRLSEAIKENSRLIEQLN